MLAETFYNTYKFNKYGSAIKFWFVLDIKITENMFKDIYIYIVSGCCIFVVNNLKSIRNFLM